VQSETMSGNTPDVTLCDKLYSFNVAILKTKVFRFVTTTYNSVEVRRHFGRICYLHKKPWPESASEVYRPSDRRLSASANFCGQRVPLGQRDRSPRPNLGSVYQSRYFLFQVAVYVYRLYQTHKHILSTNARHFKVKAALKYSSRCVVKL
jgi:hypothetical protein